MSNVFDSSLGKKLIMSITGLFLLVFLLVHLSVNLLLLAGKDAFNLAAHFMATNPLIQIMQPLLGLGFILHIVFATFLTLKNRNARPVAYAKVNDTSSSKWASRNMYLLGFTILVFLVLHLANFFWKIKFGRVDSYLLETVYVEDTYGLVTGLFREWWWYPVLYALGAIVLGFHLSHGFWSGFQTMGLSNPVWKKRLEVFGNVYAMVIGAGFSVIALYFIFF